jgi:2-dehydropantoate 2-reductase
MRIIVIGAGGVGGYFGARLARAGEDVTFVARGAHLAAMQRDGLRVRSAVDGEWTLPVVAVADLDDVAPADLVLLCVKSYDTEAALDLAAPVVAAHTGILSLQNGVDNADAIVRRFGAGHAMGGVAYVFADLAGPGVVAHHQLGRILLGEMAGAPSVRAAAFAERCRAAGIAAEVEPEIRRALWQKYVFLTALAGTSAATRLPAGALRRVPETRALWRRQVDELLALATATAVGLDPGTADAGERLLDGLAPSNFPSLCQDLRQGRRLELDALHGHAIRLGVRHGVATPTLAAIDAVLRPYLAGAPAIPHA